VALASDEVLDLLVRLVDKSLVVADEAEGDVTRYRLLETLRQYGRERLESRADVMAVQWRHAAYYLALAEEAERHPTGPEQWPWRARLTAEQGNLQAALRWFLERGTADEGLRLAVALEWFRNARGEYGEARTGLEQALALPGAASHRARARALVGVGWNGMLRVNAATTRRQLEEALMLGCELEERPTMARALLGLGMLATFQGDYPRARTLMEESLVLYRPLGDSWGIAKALGDLARVVNLEGDHARAIALLDESLALARRADEHQMVAFALEVRGEVAFATGDDAAAGRLWEESLDRYTQLGITLGIASLDQFLGLLAIRLGDHATALARYRSSLKHQRGWGYWVIRSLAGLAAVAAVDGQAERALRLAGAGLALGDGVGFQLPAPERELLERAVEAARAALGEQAATAAWAEGQAMALERAVAYALEEHAGG
jgi:tetratricopeptide (TPR) repeat protein